CLDVQMDFGHQLLQLAALQLGNGKLGNRAPAQEVRTERPHPRVMSGRVVSDLCCATWRLSCVSRRRSAGSCWIESRASARGEIFALKMQHVHCRARPPLFDGLTRDLPTAVRR